MRQITKSFILIIIIIFEGGVCQANQSESFLKMLSLIRVPAVSANGYEANEEIYQKYHLIGYGTPQDVKVNQRWKDTEDGKWINEVTGHQGEYRILGYNVSGGVVNNERFPDDRVGNLSPEEWNYIAVKDAVNSWQQIEKYQTQKQVEYMMTQNWQRKGVTYFLNAQKVGLEKSRVENFATWKTAGSIFTMKQNEDGTIWEATFSVPPMAENAELEATLSLPNGTNYVLGEGEETLEIPYVFGAKVEHLGDYASREDIENLSSEIEINFQVMDQISASRTTKIAKENRLILQKKDYPGVDTLHLLLHNTAMLETCFSSEMPIIATQEVEIEIVFQEKEEEWIAVKDVIRQNEEAETPPPRITQINLYRKSVQGEENQIALWIAKKTNLPFISAGQILVVEATIINQPESVQLAIEGDASIQTLDSLTQKFLYEEPKERHEKMRYPSLNALKNALRLPQNLQQEEGVYRIEYLIPYGTKQTIHSWATLREISQDAFDINSSKLFTRIAPSYRIKIIARNAGGADTGRASLDVFERWDTIYNRNMKEYVK